MKIDERQLFARRLADAMQTAGYEARPSTLEKLFNSRYDGRSVTFQSVSRWLSGQSIPSQDKLRVLASLFAIEPHVLRFGPSKASTIGPAGINEDRETWTAIDPADRTAIDTFLALPEPLRRHVRAVIAALR